MSTTPTSPTSPLSPLSTTNEIIYTASQNYTPKHEGEIKLKHGDIISNVKDLGNGWSLGQNITRDRLGIFPTHCVRSIGDTSNPPLLHGSVDVNSPARYNTGLNQRAAADKSKPAPGAQPFRRADGCNQTTEGEPTTIAEESDGKAFGMSTHQQQQGNESSAAAGPSTHYNATYGRHNAANLTSFKPPTGAARRDTLRDREERQSPIHFKDIRRVIAKKLGPQEKDSEEDSELPGGDNLNNPPTGSATQQNNEESTSRAASKAGKPDEYTQKSGAIQHPLVSPLYSTVAEAEGSNPEECLYTGSLPTPVKHGGYRTNPKPRLAVKPNHTHSMDSDPCESPTRAVPHLPSSPRAAHRVPPASPRLPHASPGPSRTRASPAAARRIDTGSNQGTPVMARARQNDPPRNLHLRSPDEEERGEQVLQSTSRGIVVTAIPNLSANHTPAHYDRADSPFYATRGAKGGTSPRGPACANCYGDTEFDNYTNESLQHCSPATTCHSDVTDTKPHEDFYGDYRTHKRPPTQVTDKAVRFRQNNLIYKPILKNQKIGDSKLQHIYYRDTRQSSTSTCLLFSILAGLLFGVVVFLWMYYYLDYAFVVAIGTAITVALLLTVLFTLSRLCRCTAALLLPSLCTTRGRISFLLLITGILVGGPVRSVYFNMHEVSRSMACSAEQAYNQSRLLLEPFDAMMRQLDVTVEHLQNAARDVSVGLAPLDEGLQRVEMDIENGHVQLIGTGRTCRTMISRAYDECTAGISHAQQECNDAIAALGTVYLQTKEFLLQTNLDRFAPDHVKEQHMFKRQILFGGTSSTLVDDDSDGDICRPLNTMTVCSNLNDSNYLCRPSSWAGEAIQEAINNTQSAMQRLKIQLHFDVNPDFYHLARVNASQTVYHIRRQLQGEFETRTRHFETVIAILKKLFPLAVLLLVYVSYLHVKHYMTSDTYDNNYVTENFKELDGKRAEVAGEHLLPLKRYERNYLIDATQSDLSPPEDGLYSIGLCVLFIHLILSVTCYMFDYILYWILNTMQRYGNPRMDITGQAALDNVLDGEGAIVDLLDLFLNGFHRGKMYGFQDGVNKCLPVPHAPELLYLIVIFCMYILLILTILMKAYILRFRNCITGYFYPERDKARTVHLYNVILNQRARMPKLLHARARIHNRERQQRQQISLCHKVTAKCAPCRLSLHAAPRCYVCDAAKAPSFYYCATERCGGVFCAPCYADLGYICPLCLQGMDYEDDNVTSDIIGDVYEDDLHPYHRSSKIYL